jgi:hypothetical protein
MPVMSSSSLSLSHSHSLDLMEKHFFSCSMRLIHRAIFIYLFCFMFLDKAEPDEDPEVTRAKYFIRDEFLVNKHN